MPAASKVISPDVTWNRRRRYGEKTQIHQGRERGARRQSQRAAGQKPGIGNTTLGGDAIEEQHDFGTFAQHRHAHHHTQRRQGALAGDDFMARRFQLARHFAAMAGHPDIVPGEHHHGENQDRGVEQFLARTLEQGREAAREGGDQARAQHAASTPIETAKSRLGTPLVAASTMPTIRPASITSRKTMRSAESMYFRHHHALRGRRMIFAHERIAARRQRPDADIAAGIAGDDFFHLKRGGIEFFRSRVLVGESDHGGAVGLDVNLGGREFVVLQGHRDRLIGEAGWRRSKDGKNEESALHLFLLGNAKVQLAVMGFHQSGTPDALSVWRMKPWVVGGQIV